MPFIVTPNPDIMSMNMGKTAEYQTEEEARAAIERCLLQQPSRILTLSEKIGSFTGTVTIVDPEAASAETVVEPTTPKA